MKKSERRESRRAIRPDKLLSRREGRMVRAYVIVYAGISRRVAMFAHRRADADWAAVDRDFILRSITA